MQITKPKISIIVPVYKAEPYLKKCIDSILNQTFKDFELILVDDGAPDRCGEICDEYALKDSRIKIIHKENGGQSSARNVGLDIAQGEYIGFVDSDDWIEPDMYKKLFKLLKNDNVDMVICNINSIKDKKLRDRKKEKRKIILKKGKENILNSRYKDNFLGWGPCNKLYKKDILKNIRFLDGRIYEDVPFNIEVFNKINSYVYTNDKLYNYRQLGESTTRSQISEKHLSLIYNTFYCYDITDVKFKQLTLNNIVDNCRFICISIINENKIIEKKSILIKLQKILLKNRMLLKKIEFQNFKSKIEFNMILYIPILYCIFYKIVKEIKIYIKK